MSDKNGTGAPLSWDEASRLDALRALKLLDTPPDERFDLVTRRAKVTFNVSTVLISLVDADRQWFKSRQGFEQPETSRAISFCSHAILQNDVFIVEDALLDPRFKDNPLVTSAPFVRFYAGKPLLSPDGKKIGTLCLLDVEPRVFSEADQEKLQSMASWAEREIKQFSEEAGAAHRLESRLRLAHALEHATDGFISADINGVIETANQAVCDIFRYQPTELLGKNINDLVPPRLRVQHANYMSHLLLGDVGASRTGLEIIVVRNGGEEFSAEVSFRKLESGDRQFFTGLVRDITERKNIERVKSEFVASVSHELRTPLTSILGALGMLKEDGAIAAGSDAMQLLDIAYKNSLRLNALINDILDVEKLDSEMMTFDQETVSIQELISEAQLLNLPFAKGEQIQLDVDVPEDALIVRVDHSRFIQVLTNLISNACKFSPAGERVLVQAERNGQWVTVKVIDRGPGIANEFRSRIFQRFAQAQTARDHQKTGTGLGLSISKAMIEKMGGRIGFDSIAGQGATFYVQIPLASQAIL